MSFSHAIKSDLKVVSSGHVWCEGAAWMQHSSKLLFSDVKSNKLFYYDEVTDSTVLVMDESHFSNGNTVLANGDIVSCEHGRRCLSLRKAEHLDKPRILIEKFEGKRFNSPNDVTEKVSDGTIWFTDPPYGIINDNEGYKSESQIIGCYVYCYDPNTQSVNIATTDIQRPNGLAFSPDEKTLYVADMSIVEFTMSGMKHLKAFDVENNRLVNGRYIFEIQEGIPDGMTVDKNGLIYCSSAEGIIVINPETQSQVGKIPVPEVVSNCTFNQTQTRLYITASTSVYCIDLDVDAIPTF